MNLWLCYPIEKCVAFMQSTRWALQSHILRVGPFAIALIWRVPRKAADAPQKGGE